ncbi:hypothetical protein ACLOJK_040204 [Asimina triloba]
MEMDSFPFPFPDLLSSWLQSDAVHTPAFPEDQFPDFSVLDNTHFDTTEFGGHPFFSLHSPPHHHNIDESFLLDLCCSMPMAQVGPLANQEDSCKQLSPDDFLDVVAPLESDQNFVEQVLASSPMWTTTMMTNSPETGLEMEGMALGSMSSRSQDQEENEEEEEDEMGADPPKPNTNAGLNCKNLYSERNRRKRLSQQLLALRALVPNITKMDKRSVLVDALAYVKGIQEESARIESELKERQPSPPQERNPSSNLPPKRNLASKKARAQILEIDAERMEDRRFVVKITCKGGPGVGGEVLRVMESLGFEITYVALEQLRPLHMLTTVFIRVMSSILLL